MERARMVRIAASAMALVVATFLFAWFVGGLIPGKPYRSSPESGPDSIAFHTLESLEAADVIEVPLREEKVMESLTFESESVDSSLMGELQTALSSHGVLSAEKAGKPWRFDMDDMQFQVVDAKVVDDVSFEQWYPHYADMLYGLSGHGSYETKYVVVEAIVANVGEEPEAIVFPLLWSSKFKQADSAGFLGTSTTPLLIEEMNGSPQVSSDTRQYGIEEGWSVCEPGCARNIDLAFPICRSMFVSEEGFDDLETQDFALQFFDCDPATVYRFSFK